MRPYLFGTQDTFAMEVNLERSPFCRVRVWVAGSPIGDFESWTFLEPLQRSVQGFLNRGFYSGDFSDKSASEIRAWEENSASVDVSQVSISRARQLDDIWESAALFPYPCESLAGTRIVVLAHPQESRVITWDVDLPGVHEEIVPTRDLRQVLVQFVSLHHD